VDSDGSNGRQETESAMAAMPGAALGSVGGTGVLRCVDSQAGRLGDGRRQPGAAGVMVEVAPGNVRRWANVGTAAAVQL
jgi:hypothetical protein